MAQIISHQIHTNFHNGRLASFPVMVLPSVHSSLTIVIARVIFSMASFRSSHPLYTVLPHLTSTFLNSYSPTYFLDICLSFAVQEKSRSLVCSSDFSASYNTLWSIDKCLLYGCGIALGFLWTCGRQGTNKRLLELETLDVLPGRVQPT